MEKKNYKKYLTIIITIITTAVIVRYCGGLVGCFENDYKLNFDSTFSRGLNNLDEVGLSVVIAVDCSGSMSDSTMSSNAAKYEIASQSLTHIVDFLQKNISAKKSGESLKLKIGIITYSDSVTELFPLTEMNDENFAKLKAVTANSSNFTPTSTTAIGTAMDSGVKILAQSGTIFRSLIVITDGVNTSGPSPEKVLEAIVNNVNNLNKKDEPVLTSNVLVSFVAFDIDGQVFSKLKTIGSRVISAENKDNLQEALINIFLADITKLEAK